MAEGYGRCALAKILARFCGINILEEILLWYRSRGHPRAANISDKSDSDSSPPLMIRGFVIS
jgi:hypothetical protein